MITCIASPISLWFHLIIDIRHFWLAPKIITKGIIENAKSFVYLKTSTSTSHFQCHCHPIWTTYWPISRRNSFHEFSIPHRKHVAVESPKSPFKSCNSPSIYPRRKSHKDLHPHRHRLDLLLHFKLTLMLMHAIMCTSKESHDDTLLQIYFY